MPEVSCTHSRFFAMRSKEHLHTEARFECTAQHRIKPQAIARTHQPIALTSSESNGLGIRPVQFVRHPLEEDLVSLALAGLNEEAIL